MELKSAEFESEYKAEVKEDGNVVLKKNVNIKRGSTSKSAGGIFELRVRKDLEEKEWIVDKWSNNLDLDTGVMHPAKRIFRKFNANMGVMTIGTGFPDFIAFQKTENGLFRIIGVEVKMNGTLSRVEKEKCAWYLKNGIFSEILIAKKIKEKNRVHVEYNNVEEILEKMRNND